MKKVTKRLGIVAFWLTWPGLWLYLRHTHRTRALIICGDEFLGLKSWLGDGDYIVPGGGLHRGEDPLDGVLREVKEETGLTVDRKDAEFLYSTSARNKAIPFIYTAFVIHLSKKPAITIQKHEIVDYDWLSLNDLPRNLAPDVKSIIAYWQNKK